MTTWTAITNAAVAVGGIPSSSTVTALRDNPSALAEASSGAPVMVSGWHPVDKVTIGDGKAGVIYNFATNGVVADIVTSDFEDGYEYRLIGIALSHNAGINQSLRLELYKQTDAAYDTAVTFTTGSSSAGVWFDAEILMPRLSKTTHLVRYIADAGGGLMTTTVGGVIDSTVQTILRARLIFSSGSIDAGTVYLFRRREYASSS